MFEIKKIIFDEEIWHPLDHVIGSRRCRGFQPGLKGIRKHWEYQWDFGPWRDRWGRLTGCWWGHHRSTTWHRPDGTSFDACRWCSKSMGT